MQELLILAALVAFVVVSLNVFGRKSGQSIKDHQPPASNSRASTRKDYIHVSLKPAEDPERKEFRLEFEVAIRLLKSLDLPVQMAAGHGVNVAHSLLVQKCGGIEGFRTLKLSERMQYLSTMVSYADSLIDRDPHVAMGLKLFGMLLVTISTEDRTLEKQFSQQLEFLSRLGPDA